MHFFLSLNEPVLYRHAANTQTEKCLSNNIRRAVSRKKKYVSLARTMADGRWLPASRRVAEMTSSLLARNPIHLVTESLNSCRYLVQLPSWIDITRRAHLRTPPTILFHYLTTVIGCIMRVNMLHHGYVIDRIVYVDCDRQVEIK